MARFLLPILAPLVVATSPGQRHLSYGREYDTMVAMWATADHVEKPACAFGPTEALGMKVDGTSTHIWQLNGISEVSHACELSPLVPGRRYFYKVGDDGASGVWSDVASFVARPNVTDWAPTILVYGDLGVDNDVSLGRLKAEAASGDNNFVLHVGDFAYDLNNEGGKRAAEFMSNIDPIASQLPYMTCIGNHEGGTDFDHISPLYQYMHRFWMPGQGDLVRGLKGNSVYYSFDAGPAHIVAFSSEVYFWQLWDLEQQFAFLEHDLASVDRARTPWLITMAHRPMYCTNAGSDDCTKESSKVRTGYSLAGKRLFRLEELFQKHRVDLAFWAHEHSYERTWPVFDERVMNGTRGAYINPGATVHIVAGAAGCREHHDPFKNGTAPWSAFRSELYGYGKLQIVNSSHLNWRQFEATSGSLVDEMMLVKTQAPVPAVGPVKQWKPKDMTPEDIEEEQKSREAIYKRTHGCTARGVLPEHDCRPQGSNLVELLV
eukprot:gnl/MRDRNA2_/MRDRNA2_63477_c0_seq1.p1 gnl/MRDRNA2_/MRDRNA2_63477_c0~~gnl/MRDRNA2_/MRDRNA2_63477_c0_seq1.p1  ORF type:complete len:508 (-),score=59.66 gnl/MRDRNA2_/MRDRNA2_63477_c0_seq1:93-1562(-)